MPIRVVVVDDHPLVREATQRAFEAEADIELAGTAASGQEALDLVARVQPDVLILDVHLPDISGVEVARRLALRQPHTAILVFTGYDDEFRWGLIQMGVRGYLPKTAPAAEIVDAIRALAAGHTVIGC